ncbi:MAG TPA: ABC transporter ATP-binding protein [Vicinamibacterales bacterium]|nr:ABC transporter ATP-binding protein [Vicinamibacterales bacterium]
MKSSLQIGPSGPRVRSATPASAKHARDGDKKKRPSLDVVWREARELVWAHRSRLGLGFLLMIVNRLAGLVLPASSKWLIDEVVGKSRADLLIPIALAAGAATAVQGATAFALSLVLGVAAQRSITDMRLAVQRHVERLPVRYFDSTKTGVLISRIMSDAEGIRNLVGNGIVQLVGSLLTAVIGLGVLFWLNWRLTTITLVLLAIFGGVMAMAFTRLRPLFRERGALNAEVTGRLAESLGGIRIVKAYTAERREALVFAKGAHKLFRNIAKSMVGVSTVSAVSTLIVGIIGVLMIVVGGRAILAGTMTLGEFVMYVFFTGLVAAPLVSIASIGTQISDAFAGLDRIREIRSMTTEDADDAQREPLPEIRGDVRFEDVSFEYNPGVPVLKHVTFHAPAGATTALVGSSGSGKSTLISLVMTFNRPLSGTIYIDGRDLASVRLRDFRGNLGVVLQDNFLFDGTIAENIAFARPHASREEIEAVARIAHCDDFVRDFESGYDTVVGERGVKLSGGQRQRIAIARAILADPRILILDEATSSLDSESEAMIQDGLRRLRHGRTTFVIAHRLSTIRSADQILVLEHGEIVERGTHDELLALNGRYRQLYDKQYNFERNQFVNPGEDFTPEPEPVEVGPANREREL